MRYIEKILFIMVIFMMFSLNNVLKYTGDLTKQLLFFVIGFIIFLVVSKINKKMIFKYIFPLYIILNVLLLYLLLFGESINGSKAWINLGFVSFQPSEFMKITLIILLSFIASTKEKYLLKSIILVLIPSVLTFLEPDTGNVIFYLVILFSIILLRIKNIKNILITFFILGIFGIGFLGLYFFNKSIFVSIFGSSFFYRMDRVVALFTSSSYQLDMALMNMGTSNLFGISSVYSIPEATTDFAFSLLVSLNGFIGTCIFLLTNLYFNILIIKRMRDADIIMKYIIFSFIMMKIIQESIHMLMNIGLFPITGITLPFISAGGTSLLSYFFIAGMISNNCYMDNSFDMGMDKD